MRQLSMRWRLKFLLVAAIFMLGLANVVAVAKPVSIAQVRAVARGWMSGNVQSFGIDTNSYIENVRLRQIKGVTLYYVVDLSPKGCIIVSPDDLLEPVIAFLPGNRAAFVKENPLINWLDIDLRGRLKSLSDQNIYKPLYEGKLWQKTQYQNRWKYLSNRTPGWTGDAADIRVSPLVSTRWGQNELSNGGFCFNYYTPKHYPSGCVATALAQLIRYHEWPEQGIGTEKHTIVVDNTSQSATTLGGDGNGGAYLYSTMLNDPSAAKSVTEDELRAIGTLCYDAGVVSQMQYKANGSSTSFEAARKALVTTFGYENSITYSKSGKNITTNIPEICNSNLDAGLPVLLAIGSPNSAHAVVCDGYGYSESTVYHHINFGWLGVCDTWYTLPVTTAPYNTVFMAIYNIFKNGVGEVVSGRVTDNDGRPVAGTEVTFDTIISGKQTTLKDTTDKYGVYGISNVPSDTDIFISASKPGYIFNILNVTTGNSKDGSGVCGNLWGADLSGRLLVADKTAPACTISVGSSLTKLRPLVFHVKFSEPVQGFGPECITVTNGKITEISGDWTDYTINVEPKSDGAVTCRVNEISCTDLAGNGNRISNSATITYDTSAPSVVVTKADGQSDPAKTLPIIYRVSFSEAITGFTADDIVVSAAARGVPKVIIQGGPSDYQVLVNSLVSEGTVSVSIEAGTVLDMAGNLNTASTGATNSVDYAPDTLSIHILFPTPEPACVRNVPDLILSGTSVGFGSDIKWTWSNDSGYTGTCYGDKDWVSSPITLVEGENKIVVSATDNTGKSYITELKVTYTPSTPGAAWTGLSLLSLPIEPDHVDPEIATGFVDYWSAFNPQSQRYSVYESFDHYEWFRVPAQTPGRGFWARFVGQTSFIPSGNIPDQSIIRIIRLKEGWNLIGTPYIKPVEWGLDRIMVRSPGGVAHNLSQDSYLVNTWLWGWNPNAIAPNGGSYYLVTTFGPNKTLEPWQGYWIKANRECELIIPAP